MSRDDYKDLFHAERGISRDRLGRMGGFEIARDNLRAEVERLKGLLSEADDAMKNWRETPAHRWNSIRQRNAAALAPAPGTERPAEGDCPDRGCQREAGHPPPHRSRTLADHNNVIEDEWEDSARPITQPVVSGEGRMLYGETLDTRTIVDRLIVNGRGNDESLDYHRALQDVVHYDDQHARHRAPPRDERLAQAVVDAVDVTERTTVEAIVTPLRTKYAQNRHAQEWADWIERRAWKEPIDG
jgi:hypothetical protein